jgi:diguanylate cyclase (GGDEF)-like protein/PAS domain S-box-containing protein
LISTAGLTGLMISAPGFYVESAILRFTAILLALAVSGLAVRQVRIQTRKRRDLLASLQRSEAHYRLRFERNVAGQFRADLRGRILECNEAFARLFGFSSPEETVRRITADYYVNSSDMPRLLGIMSREHSITAEHVTMRKCDGSEFDVLFNATLVMDPSGNTIEGTLIDVTRQRRSDEQIRLLLKTVQSSKEMIAITGLDDRTLFVNRAFLDGYGFREDEVIGKAMIEIIDSPSNTDGLRRQIMEQTSRGGWSGELLNRRRDGSEFPVSLSTSQIRDDDGQIVALLGIATDISEKRKAEEQIQHHAYHDPLTDLPNRTLFLDRLRVEIGRAGSRGSLAVFVLTLDRFRRINETLGHNVGDQILKAIGERLCAFASPGNTAARLGGDEFAIIVSDVTESEVPLFGRALLEVIAAPLRVAHHELVITASAGLALHPLSGSDGDALLRNAAFAARRVKESGGNEFAVHDPLMLVAEATERLSLEHELRGALQRDELQLYFQPQIDIGSGRLHGFEALLRWNSPRLGLLSPGSFIDIAEDSLLILPIGQWVLRRACQQMAWWMDAGLPRVPVAVNLSARQFLHPELFSDVERAIGDYDIPAEMLELEITESTAISRAEQSFETLARLRRIGVRISMDDFGTGYSSLSYLRFFPIDSVKIDRMFVRNVVSDIGDAAIVAGVIAMSHALGLTVVSEGVETMDQLGALQKLGCDQAQGFLFGAPIPASEIVFARGADGRNAWRDMEPPSAQSLVVGR